MTDASNSIHPDWHLQLSEDAANRITEAIKHVQCIVSLGLSLAGMMSFPDCESQLRNVYMNEI